MPKLNINDNSVKTVNISSLPKSNDVVLSQDNMKIEMVPSPGIKFICNNPTRKLIFKNKKK